MLKKEKVSIIFLLLVFALMSFVSFPGLSEFSYSEKEQIEEEQENAGTNRQNIYISASFRSGSSFLGSIFDQNPDFLYAGLSLSFLKLLSCLD